MRNFQRKQSHFKSVPLGSGRVKTLPYKGLLFLFCFRQLGLLGLIEHLAQALGEVA